MRQMGTILLDIIGRCPHCVLLFACAPEAGRNRLKGRNCLQWRERRSSRNQDGWSIAQMGELGKFEGIRGCIPKWGRVSGYLWGVTLGCSARYSGQPHIWDAPRQRCFPDHWGDLPDHWRLRPGRWLWPHLTDNQLPCPHNIPGYTLSVRIRPNLGARSSQSPGLLR